jgi:Flp pilus assembly protein TadG
MNLNPEGFNRHINWNNEPEMKARNRGQGLFEFALILPLLLIVLLGVFDLGRIFFASISLTSAAREGARYISVYPQDISSSPAFTNTRQVTIEEARNSGILLLATDVNVICPDVDLDDSCDGGQPAKVEVTHEFSLILGWLFPGPITITREAQMVVP